MEGFWRFLTTMLIVNGAILLVFIILLAMPQSRLRIIFLKIYKITMYCVTGVLALYIISPVDLIPDVILGLGQIDDLAAVISAFFTGISGLIADHQANKPLISDYNFDKLTNNQSDQIE